MVFADADVNVADMNATGRAATVFDTGGVDTVAGTDVALIAAGAASVADMFLLLLTGDMVNATGESCSSDD